MAGRDASSADYVKQRALKVTWSARYPEDRPTEEELIQAFTPFGKVARVGIKDLCAVVLFASTDSVDAAAGSSWGKWDVLPMTRPASKAKLSRKTEDPSLATASSARESQAGVVHSRPSPADRQKHLDTPETGERDVDAGGKSASSSWKAIRELTTTILPTGLKNAVTTAAMKAGRGNGQSSAARNQVEHEENDGESEARHVNTRSRRNREKVGGRKNASEERPSSAPRPSLDIQPAKGDNNRRKSTYSGSGGGGDGGGDGTHKLATPQGRTQQRHQKVQDASTQGCYSKVDRDENVISRPQYPLSPASSSDREGDGAVFTQLRTQEERRNVIIKQQRALSSSRSSEGSATGKHHHGVPVQAKQLRDAGENKRASTHAGGSTAGSSLPPAAVDRKSSQVTITTNGESTGRRIRGDRKGETSAPSTPPINNNSSSGTTNANVGTTTADGPPAGRHNSNCSSDGLFERQAELSPLSSPEGLRNWGSETDEAVAVELATTAESPVGGGGIATHCGDWGDSTAPRTQDVTDGSQCVFSDEDGGEEAVVGDNARHSHQHDALGSVKRIDLGHNSAAIVFMNRDTVAGELRERHQQVASHDTEKVLDRKTIHPDMKNSEVAMAAAPALQKEEGPPFNGGEAARTTVVSDEGGRRGGEGLEQHGSYRVEEASGVPGKQQQANTGARDQAKRLALEVARLRSALRGKTADLETESATRRRLEDENWRKLRAWEEERELMVTAKQEAERASKVLQEEVLLLRSQDKDRQEKVASGRATREAAGRKADKATEGVMKVQDRLVRALQNEVDLTNRAREASQEDAREAKEHLRLYVRDFLQWRDRAKGLEARLVALGHTQPLLVEGDTLHPTDLLVAESDCQKSDFEKLPCSKDAKEEKEEEEGVSTLDRGLSSTTRRQRSRQKETDEGNDDENIASISAPERHARYLETLTARYPFVADQLKQSRTEQAPMKENQPRENVASTIFTRESVLGEGGAAEAIQGGGMASTSRAYFDRSMQAQQEVSARLEKDLVKARADLQMIYATHENNGADDDDGGGTCTGQGGESGEGVLPSAGTPRRGDVVNECTRRGDGSNNSSVEEQMYQPSSSIVEGGINNQHPRPTGVNPNAKNTDTPINISGPYMARVLTALLGGDTESIAEATTSLELLTGRKKKRRKNSNTTRDRRGLTTGPMSTRSPAPAPPPLRLSDYPPMLQAVFSGDPAALLSPANGTSSGWRVAVKARERVTGDVSHEKEGARRQQASRHQATTRSTLHNRAAASGKARQQTGRLANERPGTTKDNRAEESQKQRASLPAAARDTSVGTIEHLADERSFYYDAQPKGVPRAAVPGVDSDKCAMMAGGAFLEYKAQSPLLQRWFEETTCALANRPA